MTETWKSYNDKYEVSDHGNVRHKRHKKILKYSYPGNGTPQVNLKPSLCVSHMVAKLFLGERPEGHDIHHKDHNPSNNHVDNLEYKPTGKHRGEHHRKYPVSHCLICGVDVSNRRQTCSIECRTKLLYEERHCLVCGKKLLISKKYIISRLKDKRYHNRVGLYCSNQCRIQARTGVPLFRNTNEYRRSQAAMTANDSSTVAPSEDSLIAVTSQDRATQQSYSSAVDRPSFSTSPAEINGAHLYRSPLLICHDTGSVGG